MRLRAFVDLAKQFKWTTSPELLNQTLSFGDVIETCFTERVGELNGLLAGEPCRNLGVTERPAWNTQLQRAACWAFPEYAHYLMLERPTHHERCTVRHWTARVAEMDILIEAAKTRTGRVRDIATLTRHLDQTLTELAELGFRQWPLKMALIDDLAAIPRVHARALLLNVMSHPDPEHRCNGCTLLVGLFGDTAIPDIVPMANDPVSGVGAHAIGLLNRAGAVDAVAPLAQLLETHPDVEIRAAAAHSLGGIGSPGAVPALLAALESDDETTALGHTPSSISADALGWLLETNARRSQTEDDIATPARRSSADLKPLKARAQELFNEWLAVQSTPAED